MPGQQTLNGRVVAVTGASRGIGAAIVSHLAAHGATVLAGARSAMTPARAGVHYTVLDVSAEDSVRQFADRAVALGVDSLVNNAGVGSFGPIEGCNPTEYHRIFDTNVLGMLLVCRAFIPHFRARHSARRPSWVVNVTSDVSDRTFAGGALYTASKHAQRAISRALSYEGASYGLRVSEIRSGMVDTHFNNGTPGTPDRVGRLRDRDIADAVMYALSAPTHARVDEILLHPVEQPVEF